MRNLLKPGALLAEPAETYSYEASRSEKIGAASRLRSDEVRVDHQSQNREIDRSHNFAERTYEGG